MSLLACDRIHRWCYRPNLPDGGFRTITLGLGRIWHWVSFEARWVMAERGTGDWTRATLQSSRKPFDSRYRQQPMGRQANTCRAWFRPRSKVSDRLQDWIDWTDWFGATERSVWATFPVALAAIGNGVVVAGFPAASMWGIEGLANVIGDPCSRWLPGVVKPLRRGENDRFMGLAVAPRKR